MRSIDRMIVREMAKYRKEQKLVDFKKRQALKALKPKKPEPQPQKRVDLGMHLPRVLLLHEAGVSLRAIGKEFGCSAEYVRQTLIGLVAQTEGK